MSVYFRVCYEGDRRVADVDVPPQAADELTEPAPRRKKVTALAHLMPVAAKAPPLVPLRRLPCG